MDIGSQSGRELVKYSYADTEMLTTPSKPIDMPEADVWFTIDEATSAVIKRAAAIFDHSQLAIEPDGGSIKLSVVDPDNATANQYTVQVDGGYDNDSFKFILNINNLRMVQDTYEVKISSKLISQFRNESGSLTYWVALEKSSTYGD